MPSRKAQSSGWSLYPKFHDQVSNLLQEDDLYFDFYQSDDSSTFIKEYDTFIMGRFICHNKACTSNGWLSGKIAITIRMYSGDRYNAKVYFQRCQACNRIGHPILDENSYVERVTYRLKKWKGLKMEAPVYSDPKRGPHRRELCEGCKAGHCKDLEQDEIWESSQGLLP